MAAEVSHPLIHQYLPGHWSVLTTVHVQLLTLVYCVYFTEAVVSAVHCKVKDIINKVWILASFYTTYMYSPTSLSDYRPSKMKPCSR